MAVRQQTDIWMVSSLTAWCWRVNTFVWPWQRVSRDGYDIGAPWHYCSHWKVCRSPHTGPRVAATLFHKRTCARARKVTIEAQSQIAKSFNDPSSVWAAIVSWSLTRKREHLWDGNVGVLISYMAKTKCQLLITHVCWKTREATTGEGTIKAFQKSIQEFLFIFCWDHDPAPLCIWVLFRVMWNTVIVHHLYKLLPQLVLWGTLKCKRIEDVHLLRFVLL